MLGDYLLANGLEILTLVKHGVESDGSLTGLTVTNDQLTLTTADGNHGVDGLETSLDGLTDGLTGQDTGGLELSTAALSGLEGTLAIDGVTQGIDDTAEKSLTDGDVDLEPLADSSRAIVLAATHNLSGTLDGLALLDETVRTEKHDTDLAGLEVHAHALDTGGEPGIALAALLGCRGGILAYSTSSSAWTLFMPWTRAIPSLLSRRQRMALSMGAMAR
jgi:hypothetical protein